jgi:hypothetical protein
MYDEQGILKKLKKAYEKGSSVGEANLTEIDGTEEENSEN